MQAEDGVLLEGRLTEYHALFEQILSYRLERDSMFGSIAKEDVAGLAARLENPLGVEETRELVDTFCARRKCRLSEDRIVFEVRSSSGVLRALISPHPGRRDTPQERFSHSHDSVVYTHWLVAGVPQHVPGPSARFAADNRVPKNPGCTCT